MKNIISKIDNDTRKILNKVHLQRIKNKKGVSRVSKYLNQEELGLNKNFFKNKICGDFGCGSHGAGGLNLLKLGAKKVHLLDLNKHIIKPINKNFKSFKNQYEISIGSLEKLPFKTNFFDFVLCQGVIHHMEKPQKAFKEIHRVLKKGSHANIVIHGGGGLLTKFTMEILRPEYRKNKLIKEVLDDLMNDNLKKYLPFINRNYNNKQQKNIKKILEILSDNDLRMTFKDRILSPKYDLYNEKDLKKYLYKIGFKNFKRTPTKPFFNNFRDYLSPLYFNYDYKLSRFLYGDGMIRFRITKK